MQSGISASIAALERDMGVTLFRRTRHRAELTPAGSALLVEARRALAAVVAGRAAAQAAHAASAGALRIGASRATPKHVQLSRVIREFRHANPGSDLYVRDTPFVVDFTDLRSGDLDLVIGPSAGRHPGVTSIPLASSPLLLAVAESHPLASAGPAQLSAIAREQFVDLPAGWATRRITDRALADAGVERGSAIEASSVDFALLLVAEGAGISLLPEIAADCAKGVAFVPFSPPVGSWEFSVSFLGDEPATTAAKAFLSLLRTDGGAM